MRLRSDYPIYLDPTFDEVLELARSGWDTIRIGVHKDQATVEHLVLASGYGNTHETLSVFMRRNGFGHGRLKDRETGLLVVPETKRFIDLDTYILWQRSGIAFFNLEDLSGPQAAREDRWERYFSDAHAEVLKDLIRESGLAL